MKISALPIFLAAVAGLWLGPLAAPALAAPAPQTAATPEPPAAAQSPVDSPHWLQGPGKVSLGGVANLALPAGFSFLGDEDARALLRSLGSLTLGNEVGFVAPPTRDWFVVVRFQDRGFVRANESDGAGGLDSARLLETLRQLDEEANASRVKAGGAPVAVQGWEIEPRFAPATHQLEWAVRASTSDRTFINHSIGLLGRSGAIQLYLVDQRRLASTAGVFRELAGGVQFHPGERYTDYQPGDRVAAGGLESLLTGGKEVRPPAAPNPVGPSAASLPIARGSAFVGVGTNAVGPGTGPPAQQFTAAPEAPAATNSPPAAPRWQQGPAKVPLGGIADLALPAGFSFLGDEEARALLRSLGSLTLGNEVGFIAPPTHDWFVVVRFHDRGFLKVSELEGARGLDSAQLLQTLRQLDEEANASRTKAGSPPVTVQGWEIEPRFAPATHQLEWAVRASNRERTFINHSIGLLGRSGVIQLYLVDQRRLATTTSVFRELAGGVQFHPGEQYADYQPGDRVAAGGLESLLTGGKEVRPSAAPNPVGPSGVGTLLFVLLHSPRALISLLLVSGVLFVFVTIVAIRFILHWRARRAWKRYRKEGKAGSRAKDQPPAFDYFQYFQDLYRDVRRDP